ncbi:MAG: hypothetical protein Q3996_00425 [Candidatus Saccharibacteria bacterium]|nr:hypothetical protein [Candidatus Saccharibacteria bacterium]
MKNILKLLLIATTAILIGLSNTAVVSATDDCKTASGGISGGVNCATNNSKDKLFGDGSVFNNVVNFLLFLIGIISVIMIIYGGIQYSLSAGDSSKVTSAKNTILYAIVGLIVAMLAFAIVNFVTGAIGGKQ